MVSLIVTGIIIAYLLVGLVATAIADTIDNGGPFTTDGDNVYLLVIWPMALVALIFIGVACLCYKLGKKIGDLINKSLK